MAEEKTPDSSPTPENTEMVETYRALPTKQNKTVSDRQYEHLKNARDKKKSLKEEKTKQEIAMQTSLDYIYNRLANIESQVSTLPKYGKRGRRTSPRF
jgi:hypothetical protein